MFHIAGTNNDFLPEKGKDILDFASGPIQYKEYLTYSKNFKKRHCVDFSRRDKFMKKLERKILL